jgi:hypothetical protein
MSACVTDLLTNRPNENRILLHSLLKKIQEWTAVMCQSDHAAVRVALPIPGQRSRAWLLWGHVTGRRGKSAPTRGELGFKGLDKAPGKSKCSLPPDLPKHLLDIGAVYSRLHPSGSNRSRPMAFPPVLITAADDSPIIPISSKRRMTAGTALDLALFYCLKFT